MHFLSQLRYNPNTGRDEKYYRIKETFRDQLGRVRSRILLNVGFLSGLRPEDIRDIGFGLTYMSEHRGKQNLFGNPLSHYSAIVREHMDKYWNKMVESGAARNHRHFQLICGRTTKIGEGHTIKAKHFQIN